MAIQVIREVAADVVKRGVTRAVYAKQNDINSRFLNVRIQEDGKDIVVAQGLTVMLNVERSDKKENIFYGTVNPDGSVQVPLTPWMLELAGTLVCDISIASEDPTVAKLTTMQFNIHVEAAVVTDESITDTEEYSVIVDLLTRTSEAISNCTQAATKAEEIASELAKAKENGEFNVQGGVGASVKPYGAKGDGVTDDTAAFQAALAENRTLFVPSGIYLLSGELVIGDNSMLELSQDTVLQFTQTTGNCISLGMLSNLKGNHATIKVPYDFEGNVIYAYSGDHTDAEELTVPPFTKWDPMWKSGRYVTDINICKADYRGNHYAVEPEDCKGSAVYLSAWGAVGVLGYMWGINFTGLRIAGAFAYGIRAVNTGGGWLNDMLIEGLVDACEIGVSLEKCDNAKISVTVQPRRAYSRDNVYEPYAKHGIELIDSARVDLTGSRVWDWENTNPEKLWTRWEKDGEYQHIAMKGNCNGAIINDFRYFVAEFDIRDRIYTTDGSNLETLTVIQEPITKYFRVLNKEPYVYDGQVLQKLMTRSELDNHFDTGFVKQFTDLLPTAIDTDGTVYNGIGYKKDIRYIEDGRYIESPYYVTTGFIPFKKGSTIYTEDMSFDEGENNCKVILVDKDFNYLYHVNRSVLISTTSPNYFVGYEKTEKGFACTLKNLSTTTYPWLAEVAYIRIVIYHTQWGNNPMISVDEEIKYTVEGFLADGVKVKGENVIGEIGAKAPDWVATKEKVVGGSVMLPETYISFTGSMVWSGISFTLNTGVAYDIYWNDTYYRCIAFEHNGEQFLGNADLQSVASIKENPLSNKNAPFLFFGTNDKTTLLQKNTSGEETVRLKVEMGVEYEYNKMPPEYLPDGVVKSVNGALPDTSGNVEVKGGVDVTAEVGQTIVVEEVDGNGKPTKWKAVEYQPRTHWQGEKVMIPEHTFEAGLIDGGPSVKLHGDESLIGLTIGKTYKVVFDGVTYTCVAEAGVVTMDGVNMINIISIGNLGMFGGVDNGLPFILGDLPDYDPSSWTCIPYVYGEHTLSVTGLDETNTIPVKYLSEGFPYYIEVNCETDNSATTTDVYTCDDTVENVKAIFASGREIKIRFTYTGENATPLIQIFSMFVYAENSGLVFFGFSSSGLYGTKSTLYLESQEDGTFAVTDSLGD